MYDAINCPIISPQLAILDLKQSALHQHAHPVVSSAKVECTEHQFGFKRDLMNGKNNITEGKQHPKVLGK